jgi:hypothetical protein
VEHAPLVAPGDDRIGVTTGGEQVVEMRAVVLGEADEPAECDVGAVVLERLDFEMPVAAATVASDSWRASRAALSALPRPGVAEAPSSAARASLVRGVILLL